MCTVFAILAVLAVIYFAIKKGASSSYEGLVASGKTGQGILLRVAPTGTRTRRASFDLETRSVRIDVEVPGEEPYEVNVSVVFPANFAEDVLPGASVEVRVDQKDRTKIAIIGPCVGVPGAPLQRAS